MPDAAPSPDAQASIATFDALVIGAGFAGLYALHLLRNQQGLKVRVLEAADGVGGTWYWNRYPGARCDSESWSYCFQFDDALVQEWTWSERYPRQPEILRYLNHVADRYDLRRDIAFSTRVTGARFDEASDRWVVTTDRGERLAAPFLITAVGCLSAANIPDIPGLADFRGRWVHTGEWPHEGVDFRGKRVGMIGTGSTGIQAAPVIAEEAAQLTVFQRTPNYSVPAQNHPLDDAFRARKKAEWPVLRRLMRSNTNGHPYTISERDTFSVSEEERRAAYAQAWDQGGLSFRATFRDMMVNKAANDEASAYIRERIRAIVKDPRTAELLTAFDHPFATKRPPIDTGYFETFNRDNVRLVDIRATPIERIAADGIVIGGETIPLDIIVFATGFDAMTGPLLKLGIAGPGGRTLAEAWAEGPRTYLGLGVEGFPNLFTVTGPGSPSVLTNMPVAIEQHVEWIASAIAWARANRVARIEATGEAARNWTAHVNEVAERTLYPTAKSSWYLGANIPGKPRVFMPYLGGLGRYREICDEVAASGYRGFAVTPLRG
ncbi:flavin-containing monooxygenase [Elioraea rosea]|uniref:flavin-containing monooxygenase n=1 Tax=Elioraea rosea TaxID=2492390 RepID=UPI001185376F|nr:NAD(P)/FAD-dependent oxidoreductase [Elioraea rosea]